MKLLYNDTEITDLTRILRCEIEQYLEEHVDTMTIAFDNSQDLWTGWGPKRGDKIRMSEGYVDSGEMVVITVRPENGKMVLDTAPLLDFQGGQIKAYKKVSFTQIAREVAKRLGLKLTMYGVKEQKYEGVEQKGESDLIFFNNLCKLEGCSFIVSDGRMLVMSREYLSKLQLADYTLDITSCRINDDDYYTYCTVTDGITTGRAGDKKGQAAELSTDRKLESIGQANRFAENMLYYLNKNRKGGNVLADSLLDAAMVGTKLKISCGYWTGKEAMITRARYDLIRNTTKLWFRLEE